LFEGKRRSYLYWHAADAGEEYLWASLGLLWLSIARRFFRQYRNGNLGICSGLLPPFLLLGLKTFCFAFILAT
jgi:ABC-type polysaccharide/polyol phosphate export permease